MNKKEFWSFFKRRIIPLIVLAIVGGGIISAVSKAVA